MNFKKIITLFCICLPLCIAARIVQITVFIENSNGFYKYGYEHIGNACIVFVAIVCVGLAIAAFKAYKDPRRAPKVNPLLTVASFCMAFSLFAETCLEKMPVTMPSEQLLIVKAVTLFCGVYFVVFGLQGFTEIRIAPLLHIMPCLYTIVKTIFTFINISSLALISDNVLLVAGYCFLMLFFINFGKLHNRLDTELNFRKILATGLGSAMLCATQSLAYFLVNIFGKGYSHSDTTVMISLFSFSFFIIAFVVSHFTRSKK